jgi:hypothetical protein
MRFVIADFEVQEKDTGAEWYYVPTALVKDRLLCGYPSKRSVL